MDSLPISVHNIEIETKSNRPNLEDLLSYEKKVIYINW